MLIIIINIIIIVCAIFCYCYCCCYYHHYYFELFVIILLVLCNALQMRDHFTSWTTPDSMIHKVETQPHSSTDFLLLIFLISLIFFYFPVST